MIGPVDRRTISELQARYELEPTLQDVYVEGPTDRALLDLAIAHLGFDDRIRSYEVNDVELPASLLETRALAIGNKGRVIALADELETGCKRDLRASVACLADLDFDDILGARREHSLLVYTSGLSVDSAIATPFILGKFLSVVLLSRDSADGLYRQMLPILNERVLHRVAFLELGIKQTDVDIARDCTYTRAGLVCDLDRYVERLLQSAGVRDRQREFRRAVDAHRDDIATDPTRFIHVDDFVALLRFCAHKIKRSSVPDQDTFRRFLLGFLEVDLISQLPEIKDITSRFGLP